MATVRQYTSMAQSSSTASWPNTGEKRKEKEEEEEARDSDEEDSEDTTPWKVPPRASTDELYIVCSMRVPPSIPGGPTNIHWQQPDYDFTRGQMNLNSWFVIEWIGLGQHVARSKISQAATAWRARHSNVWTPDIRGMNEVAMFSTTTKLPGTMVGKVCVMGSLELPSVVDR